MAAIGVLFIVIVIGVVAYCLGRHAHDWVSRVQKQERCRLTVEISDVEGDLLALKPSCPNQPDARLFYEAVDCLCQAKHAHQDWDLTWCRSMLSDVKSKIAEIKKNRYVADESRRLLHG